MRRKHSAVQMFIAAILGLALLAASCAGIAEQETAGADTFLQEVVDALGDPDPGSRRNRMVRPEGFIRQGRKI